MTQELDIFLDLVAAMRRSQRAYFRNRFSADLENAKRLERLVDEAIKDLKSKQASLFAKSTS